MNDSAMLLIAAEILISCIAVVCGLFWLLRRRNQQFRKIEHTLAKQSRALVEVFLERELQATQILAQDAQNDELTSALVRLRSFWLEAERQALVEHGAHTSNHRHIANALKGSRIYTQLKAPPKPPAKPATALPHADNSRLDDARRIIEQQQTVLTEIQHSPAIISEAAREISAATTANSENLLHTIRDLETELRRINTLYQQTSAQLETLSEAGDHNAPPASNIVIVSSATAAADPTHTRELLEEMRATYQHGLRELQRLRETNTRQRDLIMEMEQRLLAIAPHTGPDGETRQLIDKLQLQLRDYDNCTTILEMESESLRERIDTLTQIIEVDSKTSAPGLREMPAEMAQKYLQARRSLDKKAFDMMQGIGCASDLENAAGALMGFLQSQKLHVAMYIHGQQKQLWLSSEGAVDTRIKSLLQSVQPKPGNPRVDDGEHLMLLLPTCRMHMAGENFSDEDGELLKGWLSRTLVIVDLIFKLLDTSLNSQGKYQIDSTQITDLGQVLSAIETQHLYLESETQRITASHREEIEKILSAVPATPAQKVVIEELLDDFSAEADLIARAAKSLHKSLHLAQQSVQELKA